MILTLGKLLFYLLVHMNDRILRERNILDSSGKQKTDNRFQISIEQEEFPLLPFLLDCPRAYYKKQQQLNVI